MARERHVIDDAGLKLVLRAAADQMQDGLVAEIQPRAGKVEVGTRPGRQSEQFVVEVDSAVHIVGQDREMVHAVDLHLRLRLPVRAPFARMDEPEY